MQWLLLTFFDKQQIWARLLEILCLLYRFIHVNDWRFRSIYECNKQWDASVGLSVTTLTNQIPIDALQSAHRSYYYSDF